MIGDRQDALRYRWLRERLYSTLTEKTVTIITFRWPAGEEVGGGPKLDAAIDRILKSEKAK